MGEHTRDVLGQLLRMGEAEVDALVERGVVATEGGPDVSTLL
jgi:hypothetical protein